MINSLSEYTDYQIIRLGSAPPTCLGDPENTLKPEVLWQDSITQATGPPFLQSVPDTQQCCAVLGSRHSKGISVRGAECLQSTHSDFPRGPKNKLLPKY